MPRAGEPQPRVPDGPGPRNFPLVFIAGKFTAALGSEIVQTRLATILQRSSSPPRSSGKRGLPGVRARRVAQPVPRCAACASVPGGRGPPERKGKGDLRGTLAGVCEGGISAISPTALGPKLSQHPDRRPSGRRDLWTLECPPDPQRFRVCNSGAGLESLRL